MTAKDTVFRLTSALSGSHALDPRSSLLTLTHFYGVAMALTVFLGQLRGAAQQLPEQAPPIAH